MYIDNNVIEGILDKLGTYEKDKFIGDLIKKINETDPDFIQELINMSSNGTYTG